MSDIKEFIKEGGKFPGLIARERIPLEMFDENMRVHGRNIPMQNVKDPTHIIGIYKVQSHYYAVVGLFIGLDETAPLYFVPLMGDKNEIDPDYLDTELDTEVVRVYNFGYLVKKEPQQESVTSDTIDIPEGSSPYVITPVSTLELLELTHLINMSKNSSKLLKDIEREYRRRT